MRFVRLAAALLLAGAVAVGCGNGDAEPEATAEEKFCAAFRDYYERSEKNAGEKDAVIVASMKEFAEEADGLTPPKSMSSDAKAGLQAWIDLIADVPDDASQAEVAELSQKLSPKQIEQLDAYYLYANARCLSAATPTS
ncbi:hypothetical protein [Nocardioides daphniae]|uniref:Lipoprotein n=1 Tax=Nocardioides daphniae TaxID=402297 RepID=A0A4V1CW59_9ACTN|nr:hypothetical protein [Nocardioides daphniae]QCC76127.1 hypothetical protein E2C04_01005 [Nocardioides daphniae]GGD09835.1 hypothetical protein GCM10007231_05850 [Nocardioides daphniae]